MPAPVTTIIFLLLATERERFDRALLVIGSEDEDSARDSVAIAVIVEEEEEDELEDMVNPVRRNKLDST